MEMIFPVIFALFLFYKPSVSYPSIREKIVEFFSQIRTSEHILLGFSSLLVAVSVFLTGVSEITALNRHNIPKLLRLSKI